MQSRTMRLWRSLGIIHFVWCLGVLGFGQAFFIIRLFVGIHFGQPIADMNLYFDLAVSLIAGVLWALIMWYALVNRYGDGNDPARSTP